MKNFILKNKSSYPLIFLLLSILVLAVSPLLGSISLPFFTQWSPEESQIFWSVRLPRVLLAFFVGGLLAICGSIYQAIFRNPLASPYTLGVSSGAALGSTIGIVLLGGFFDFAYLNITLGILGSVATVILISFISRSMKGDLDSRLLLSGVILSFFFSSIILFLQYLGDFTQIFRISRWLMGSVETVGYESVILIAFTSITILVVLLIQSPQILLLSMGVDFASTKGVDTGRLILRLFLLTSLAVGVVVSICGPIGFIGVAVPFAIRALGISSYKDHILSSYLLGALLLCGCDTFGRVVISPAEIPVGVITAMFGAPVVIWLLIRKN